MLLLKSSILTTTTTTELLVYFFATTGKNNKANEMKWKKVFSHIGKKRIKESRIKKNSVPKKKINKAKNEKVFDCRSSSYYIFLIYFFISAFFSVCFFHFHLILQEFFFVLFCFVPLCLCCVGRILCVYVCFRQNFFYEIFSSLWKIISILLEKKKRMASKKERKTKNKHQHCVNEKERKKKWSGESDKMRFFVLFCFHVFSLSHYFQIVFLFDFHSENNFFVSFFFWFGVSISFCSIIYNLSMMFVKFST